MRKIDRLTDIPAAFPQQSAKLCVCIEFKHAMLLKTNNRLGSCCRPSRLKTWLFTSAESAHVSHRAVCHFNLVNLIPLAVRNFVCAVNVILANVSFNNKG